MLTLGDWNLIAGLVFFLLGTNYLIKFPRFAQRVHLANIRPRYKVSGWATSILGFGLGLVFLLISILFCSIGFIMFICERFS